MKKLISILLSVVMVLGLMSVNVFADESIKVRLLNYHDKDGNLISEKYIDFDVAPTIIDGRTMVPIRAVAEELGYYVSYDKDTGAVSLIGAFEEGKYNQGACIGYLGEALNHGEMVEADDESWGLDIFPNFAINVAMGTADETHNCNDCKHYMLSLKFPTRVLTDEERAKHPDRNDWWLGDNYLYSEQTGLDIKVSFIDNIKVMDALTSDCANYDFDELGSCEIIYDYSADVLPVIIDGRTLLPLRAISESMGLGVSWDGTTNTVTLDAKTPYFNEETDCEYENDVFNLKIGELWWDTVRRDFDITVEGPNGKITKNTKDYETENEGIYYIPFEIGSYSVDDEIKISANEEDFTIHIDNGNIKIVEDTVYYTIGWDYTWDYETNRLKLVPLGHKDYVAEWHLTESSVEE